jgi:tRNA pseudouridine55 synthase
MNGIAIIDKPAGITSADVVRRVKKLVRPARVGHLGTLDPFATGVLPILIGEATKLAPFMEGGDKRYRGVIRLGAETDTLDPEGAAVRTALVPPLNREILARLEHQFTGRILQTPPTFSAIKRAGVPMYKLARMGVDVEPPPPREVEIRFLKLEVSEPDMIAFELVCSTGTYVRALARDLGIAIGSAAHLAELRRLWSGGYSIEQAVPLDDFLCALGSPGLQSVPIITLSDALPGIPAVRIKPEQERRLRNGDSSALDMMAPATEGTFKVLDEAGGLVAIARATSRVTAVIERIFKQTAGSDL